jgi:sodium-dependent dicarboxylate transporter 2/3/5
VFLAVFQQETGQSVPFYQWMLLASPVAVLMLGVAWLVLTWRLGGTTPIEIETDATGWTIAQKRVLAVFGLAALAWITREVPLGGWSAWFGTSAAGDSTVALLAVLAMFLIPDGSQSGERLLDWPTAVRIPWGILILFGGGIAIARAFDSSGLSSLIGESVHGWRTWPPLAVIGTLSLATTFMSEFTSNTAASNILMPILAGAATAGGINPALLMVPATLSNSLAFMMPVGTPPNAIVCGSGHVRIADMVRYGLVLNLVGVVIVTLACWWLLPAVFGVSAGGR